MTDSPKSSIPTKLYIVGNQFKVFAAAHDNVMTSFAYANGAPFEPDTAVVHTLGTGGEVVEPKLAHKARAEHVLISRDAPGVFSLVLGNQEDRLCDRASGQHVSGMVLLEAGRQAAAVELEVAYRHLSATHAACWQSVLMDFRSFAFPLPTELRVTVHEYLATPSKVETDVHVEFLQAERGIARAEYGIHLIERTILARLEQRAAARAVRS